MRALMLHTGAGKTGTTALQVFFEEHRDWLAGHGVHYPLGPATPGGGSSITSGNGVWLFNYLTEGRDWEEFWTQLQSTPEDSDVLFSSELLAHGHPDRLTDLRARAAAEGFRLKAVYLVRNPDEWFLSAYQQLVKRHGLAKTFDEFCDWYPLEFPRTITKYDSILEDNFSVLSYEAGKQDLIPYFLRNALGIEEPPPPSEIASTNRSLTRLELEVLIGANALLANTGMTDNAIGASVGPISDLLVSAFPTIERSSRFSERMPERAIERWRPEVDEINERLREGRLDFSVSTTSPPITENERALARMAAILIAGQVRPSPAAPAPAEQAEELADEIHALRSSTSWRMTAPLRRAVMASRLRRGNGKEASSGG